MIQTNIHSESIWVWQFFLLNHTRNLPLRASKLPFHDSFVYYDARVMNGGQYRDIIENRPCRSLHPVDQWSINDINNSTNGFRFYAVVSDGKLSRSYVHIYFLSINSMYTHYDRTWSIFCTGLKWNFAVSLRSRCIGSSWREFWSNFLSVAKFFAINLNKETHKIHQLLVLRGCTKITIRIKRRRYHEVIEKSDDDKIYSTIQLWGDKMAAERGKGDNAGREINKCRVVAMSDRMGMVKMEFNFLIGIPPLTHVVEICEWILIVISIAVAYGCFIYVRPRALFRNISLLLRPTWSFSPVRREFLEQMLENISNNIAWHNSTIPPLQFNLPQPIKQLFLAKTLANCFIINPPLLSCVPSSFSWQFRSNDKSFNFIASQMTQWAYFNWIIGEETRLRLKLMEANCGNFIKMKMD